MARATSSGNFVSEWYGHRVYPVVTKAEQALADQRAKRCPFLSLATLTPRECVKPPAASGVCTVSSNSNGPRQDWLACPYRALDANLLQRAVSRVFQLSDDPAPLVIPAPALADVAARSAAQARLTAGGALYVYLQNKLGGEISIPSSARSPEFAFDSTVVELVVRDGAPSLTRYGILELQTMDFHGSFRNVVANLTDGLRLHPDRFHAMIEENQARWLGERVEGPNIANVFKRTFYQMLFKFHIGAHEPCAGCILAIPLSVWDSWQRHLGRPDLVAKPDGTSELFLPTRAPGARVPAWIFVFDLVTTPDRTPDELVLVHQIATDAEAIAHYAVRVAPDAAVMAGGVTANIIETIRRRIAGYWPELFPPMAARRPRRGPSVDR